MIEAWQGIGERECNQHRSPPLSEVNSRRTRPAGKPTPYHTSPIEPSDKGSFTAKDRVRVELVLDMV